MPFFRGVDTGYDIHLVITANRNNKHDYKLETFASKTEAEKGFLVAFARVDCRKYQIVYYRFVGGKNSKWHKMKLSNTEGNFYTPVESGE